MLHTPQRHSSSSPTKELPGHPIISDTMRSVSAPINVGISNNAPSSPELHDDSSDYPSSDAEIGKLTSDVDDKPEEFSSRMPGALISNKSSSLKAMPAMKDAAISGVATAPNPGSSPRQVSSSPPISEISLHHCLFKTSDIASSRLFTGLKTLTPAKSPVLLGRASSTDSSAKDQRDTGWFECQVVSRQHAQIEWAADESKVFIVDLGSTHGTYLSHKAARLDQGAWVEGELDAPTIRLVPHVKYELQHGDCIALGKPVEKAGQTFRAIEAYVVLEHELEMGPGQKCKVSAHNLHKYELRTATSGTYWASKRLRGFRLGTEEQLDPNDSVGTTSHQSLSAPPADPDGVEARDAALGKDQQPIPTMVAEFDGGVVPIPSEAGSAGIKHPQGPEARTRTGNTRSRGSFCVSDEVEAILKARLQFPAIERGGAMEMGGSPLWPGEDDLNDVGLDREHIELLRCVRRYEEEERNGDESESEAGQSEGSPFSETADLLLDENHHLSAGKSNEEAREDRFKGSCELRRVARAAEDMLRRGPPRFSSENEPSPKHEPTALPTARGRPRSEKNNAEVADVALVNLQQQCESNVQGASDTFSAEAQGENAVLSLGFDYESTRRTDRAPGNGKGLYSQQSSAVDHETVEQRNVAAGKQPQNDHRVTLADVERTVNSAMERFMRSAIPEGQRSLEPVSAARGVKRSHDDLLDDNENAAPANRLKADARRDSSPTAVTAAVAVESSPAAKRTRTVGMFAAGAVLGSMGTILALAGLGQSGLV